jgi:N-methylhydantoinase B
VLNAVELSVFVSRCSAICDEMGNTLRASAFSPNIKDRLDFSCALFDAEGKMLAQAAHVPVHLGSMAFAMQGVLANTVFAEGDELIWNDPFVGGTHLPDVTLVRPIFIEKNLLGFVANRAHHARIGADTPGSMPLSTHLDEEGLLIAPSWLQKNGERDEAMMAWLTSKLGADTAADLAAQSSANRIGVTRLGALIDSLSVPQFIDAVRQLNGYGRTMAKAGVREIPNGCYTFVDQMDSDGQGSPASQIQLTVTVSDEHVCVDFSGTCGSVPGNINCPLTVTAAAVFYSVFCLLPPGTPACAGAFEVIEIKAEVGALVHAQRPSATAAGNVETSMRIVDCMFGALAKALPEQIPAASQGTMNNVAMGEVDRWDYYETLGGGTGAGPSGSGISGVQSHMTNTLNTPIEVMESNFPIEVLCYRVRRGSGGAGLHRGGDGLERSYRFLSPTEVTLITERRHSAPWGLAGGDEGATGLNLLDDVVLPDKAQLRVEVNQVLTILTPGGGGWGAA